MKPAFVVRPAEEADLPELLRLERATPEAPHWPEAEYLRIVAAEPGPLRRCLFVAWLDGDLAGFAVGKTLGDEAELESVAVDAGLRRMGLGAALCRAVMDWCRRQEADAIDLEVRAGSAGAMRLYHGLGFEEVGRRTAYYRDPVEDAVLMRRELLESHWLW
ncbi:ribosomal-protein-alanine N-acetyltransferase [Granulicella rosea]|uniref:Ribosomal-protein-alanine N-acetyltransferase n=1 Tax=Granulicella rosea TaxID=474952 RepID=A0A239ENK8_9BACT|nr:GNAT family N-acetyltransferase [Granulicella rosea]SNS45991.1 ribosomal-protein-alanine N-acetyltransferase [Granulicella rosea]